MPIEPQDILSLRRSLKQLQAKCGVVGVKGGTETEDMSFDELSLLQTISCDIVPMCVKIGGSEAKNDIRHCLRNKIHTILCPMTESAYALRNFVQTTLNLQQEYAKNTKPTLAINLESIQGLRNLCSITQQPEFQEHVSHVTIGRSDFSASMNLNPEHPKISHIACEIVTFMKKLGKITSVGGNVTPSNAQTIIQNIRPNRINTRHVVMIAKIANSEQNIRLALNFEIDFCRFLQQQSMSLDPTKAKFWNTRIANIKKRYGA